jgi:hypothetical protein
MTLEQRITRLERQLRWLKRLGALAIAVGAVVVLVGQGFGEEPRTLEATALYLKDRVGKVRASFRLKRNGNPELLMLDEDQSPRITLVVRPDQAPALNLLGKKGRASVVMTSTVGGSHFLSFADKVGSTRIRLGTASDTMPYLHVFDMANNVIWKGPWE